MNTVPGIGQPSINTGYCNLYNYPVMQMALPFYLFTFFLGPNLWHMEVPRLEVEWEL